MLCEPDHISGRICLLHQHHHLGRVGVENIMLSRVSGLAPKWPAMTRIFVHQKSFAFLSQHTSCHVRYMKTIQSHPSNSFDFWSAAEVWSDWPTQLVDAPLHSLLCEPDRISGRICFLFALRGICTFPTCSLHHLASDKLVVWAVLVPSAHGFPQVRGGVDQCLRVQVDHLVSVGFHQGRHIFYAAFKFDVDFPYRSLEFGLSAFRVWSEALKFHFQFLGHAQLDLRFGAECERERLEWICEFSASTWSEFLMKLLLPNFMSALTAMDSRAS